MRGVSRPMTEKQIRQHQHDQHQEVHEKDGHSHKMGKEMQRNMLQMHHIQTLWIYWAIIINISSAITGLIVAALAIPRGPKTENYGLWNKYG